MTNNTRSIRCRRRFRSRFPGGFRDATYLAWERDSKWGTHTRWASTLGKAEHARLLLAGEYDKIATRALRVEQQSRHSMIGSSEYDR